MEFEFDKEIDAILRKAQGGVGVSAKAGPNHLDADSIAAFVENALPEKAKFLYMEHFADCDGCRKQLSFAISMNAEADQPTASIVSDAVAATVIPWYQKLFRSQNLAIALGALVLSFGGLIGYLALQNKDGLSSSDDVAMEKAPSASVPYSSGAVTNTATPNSVNVAVPIANAASTAANVIANSNSVMVSPSLSQPASADKIFGEKDERKKVERSDSDAVTFDDSASTDTLSSGTAPPPPPAMAPAPAKPTSTSEPSKSKDNELALSGRRTSEENMAVRDAPPKTAAKRNSGPSRAAGNVQQQQQMDVQVYDKGATQRVGGRMFDNRNGVWYDLAYNGQSTISVARGSHEYKKLDGSIKRIAENLTGTVVVMWKNKAYRIQ